MIKHNVMKAGTNDVLFTADIDCDESQSNTHKLRLAALWKYDIDRDLRGANLRNADLTSADLSGSDLSGSYLSDSDLSDSDLRGADLTNFDLSDTYFINADLSGTILTDANLSGSYLRDANLTDSVLGEHNTKMFKSDLWEILNLSVAEVPYLIEALKDGRVDGSTYKGECACLVGTLDSARNESLPKLPRNYDRPAEQWFSMINKGDKPQEKTGGGYASKMALEWIQEW